MPGTVVIPGKRDPWEYVLPQLITQMALAHIGQKMKLETAEKITKIKSDYAKASKPENVPEGFFTFFDGDKWQVKETAQFKRNLKEAEQHYKLTVEKGIPAYEEVTKQEPGPRRLTPLGFVGGTQKRARYMQPTESPMGKEVKYRRDLAPRAQEVMVHGRPALLNPDGTIKPLTKDTAYKPDIFEYTSGPRKGEQFYLDPGAKIPDNAKRVSPVSTKVEITQGKVLPAGEAGKLGEIDAYTSTMNQITRMIGTGQIDTGPFEFVKEKLDNWGVMPKEERIKLRTLVARLPGLMYAMRGKQLSDKELEVALKMMPRMEMDEKAFKIALDNFSDYMQKVLKGKTAAFKGAGYNVEGLGGGKSTQPPLDSFFR